MNLLKSRFEATAQSDEEVARIRANIKNSPFRLMVEYDIEVAINEARVALSKAKTEEDFRTQQGIIEGLQKAVGIINRTK